MSGGTKAAEKRARGAVGRLKDLLKNTYVIRAAWCVVRLTVGFALPGAEIFGTSAPFGVSLAAAGGFGVEGLFTAIGVILGYIRLGTASGMRLAAAAALVSAASFLLRDTEAIRKKLFMPALAAVFCGMMNLSMASSGRLEAITVWLLCAALSGGCAYFFRFALKYGSLGKREEDEGGRIAAISCLIFLTSLFMALSKVTLIANISAGRLCASLVTVYAARREGMGRGSAVGLSIGLAMDISLGGAPMFAVAYAFSGLIAGMFRAQSKLLFTAAYILADAAASLWVEGSAMRLSLLYETFVASVVFMALPEAERRAKEAEPLPSLFGIREKVTREAVRERLENAARAFREMYAAMSAALTERKGNDNDTAVVFSRTADRLCRRCKLANLCWGKEVEATKNAVNEAVPKIMKKGRLDAGDVPKYFSSRCIHFPEFVDTANQEVRGLMERRQQKARQRENENLAFRQFSEVSNILSGAAEEAADEYEFLPEKEKEVYRLLGRRKLEAGAAVYRGRHGRLFVEIGAAQLPAQAFDEEFAGELEEALEVRLYLPEEQKNEDGHRLRYLEREPYRVVAGAAARRKEGQSVSGDSATYFRTEEGELFVLLADGMGSGEEAARESRLTVAVMERLLKAGVAPEIALRTANSAFMLKNREEGVFSTLDLLKINLFSGSASVYKFGAAPSYIKREKLVSRVGQASLPLGMSSQKPINDMSRVKLRPGDYVVVASDGLADKNKDEWLIKELGGYAGDSPAALADALLKKGAEVTGRGDDITIYVFRLELSETGKEV